jgi:N-methylhydantoinase B/oxoprolinase/acetone carboxylase alpha subunit
MSPTKATTAKAKTKAVTAKGKAAAARTRKPSRPAAVVKRAVAAKTKPKAAKPAVPLKQQLAMNDKLFKDTGHMFGLTKMKRKQADPGTYEAAWHILLNVCNTGWVVGCKVSSSPAAVEGGDAVWVLHLPTGEAVCTSRGIISHPGLLSQLIRSYIENDYEVNPGFRPGDIFENNDPHYGGLHSPDFQTTIPIFYRGELIGWASSVSHVMDAGMVLPGSIGFLNPDCFSDGVPITMERVGENDAHYPWYDRLMRSRTRQPEWVIGDARGRLAGCLTIRDRVIKMIEKYGVDFFKDVTREFIEDSRRYAVSRIKTQTVPGRIRKSNFKDLAMRGKRVIKPEQDVDIIFNEPMEIVISGSGKTRFSMRGASGWVPFGENITPKALISAMMNGFSHMVGFDMFNWGSAAAWELETPPPGSWGNPFPVNYFASSGVAWAPAVLWLGSLYESLGRLYWARGFIEEVAAGPGTTMCGEFAGVNQYGLYSVGMTLEQASNGVPARGMGDGENSAWSIYTPIADFGNAEVNELFYPIMYLGRNAWPDSGGYGKFRGGLGHTAVWLVKGTPGIEYMCACAGLRSKILSNHGMFGAYPKFPDRGGYASKTNVKELIDGQQPLVHAIGDPEHPDLVKNIKAEIMLPNEIAPFVSKALLHEYDVIVNPITGAEALGDPIERSPALVKGDLDNAWTRPREAESIYGVVATYSEATREWTVDEAATDAKRAAIRAARKERGVPFKQWWQEERKKVLNKEQMAPPVLDMWRSSMQLSPDYGKELKQFWNLPDDFAF